MHQRTTTLRSTTIKCGVLCCLLVASSVSEGALISSTLDTFSNNTSGGTPPAEWTSVNPGNQTLALESSFADRDALDGAADGYLNYARDSDSNQTIGAIRALGDVAAADVGKVINIDVAYERTSGGGSTTNYELLLDGMVVSSAQVNIFGSGNDPAAGTGLLSAVVGSPISYVIDAGDVGKVATFQTRHFASNPNRELGLDAVSFSIVPEPATASLLVFGLLAMTSRRIRNA